MSRPRIVEILDALLPFADHGRLCAIAQWRPIGPEDFDFPACNCGFWKLRDEAKAILASAAPPISRGIVDPLRTVYAVGNDGTVYLIGAIDRDDAQRQFAQAAPANYIGTSVRPFAGRTVMVAQDERNGR